MLLLHRRHKPRGTQPQFDRILLHTTSFVRTASLGALANVWLSWTNSACRLKRPQRVIRLAYLLKHIKYSHQRVNQRQGMVLP